MNKEENSNINNKGDKIELPKDLHVLVVDDDSIFRESISKLLKQLGFRGTLYTLTILIVSYCCRRWKPSITIAEGTSLWEEI